MVEGSAPFMALWRKSGPQDFVTAFAWACVSPTQGQGHHGSPTIKNNDWKSSCNPELNFKQKVTAFAWACVSPKKGRGLPGSPTIGKLASRFSENV